MLWQLPLFNAWVTGWHSACPMGVGWTSVFSGQAADNIVSSGMVSNTCEIEETFSPLLSINPLLRRTE